MKSKLNKILLGVLVSLGINANAASFKGYKKKIEGKVFIYTETAERFTETQDEFLILMSRHAAFYRFPKSVAYAAQVRDFLNNRIKTKQVLIFEVDPMTAKILNISDVQK